MAKRPPTVNKTASGIALFTQSNPVGRMKQTYTNYAILHVNLNAIVCEVGDRAQSTISKAFEIDRPESCPVEGRGPLTTSGRLIEHARLSLITKA